jgi:hypothetical protein
MFKGVDITYPTLPYISALGGSASGGKGWEIFILPLKIRGGRRVMVFKYDNRVRIM